MAVDAIAELTQEELLLCADALEAHLGYLKEEARVLRHVTTDDEAIAKWLTATLLVKRFREVLAPRARGEHEVIHELIDPEN